LRGQYINYLSTSEIRSEKRAFISFISCIMLPTWLLLSVSNTCKAVYINCLIAFNYSQVTKFQFTCKRNIYNVLSMIKTSRRKCSTMPTPSFKTPLTQGQPSSQTIQLFGSKIVSTNVLSTLHRQVKVDLYCYT
jgi:hypothetical protein